MRHKTPRTQEQANQCLVTRYYGLDQCPLAILATPVPGYAPSAGFSDWVCVARGCRWPRQDNYPYLAVPLCDFRLRGRTIIGT
ncbi:hypothetical protein [Photorhabdus sp. HUG-39]|uniref:hypothetical protein n=1 Tax=Photorhabdus sp. HUG-39 TaxID=2029680 RepID=UPI001961BDA4|nr:hypothetical protein [Photorhabdus sp. HUG-39]